jgi:hypothetical protein
MRKKTYNTIVPQGTTQAKRPQQLCLPLRTPQIKPGAEYPLRIEALPPSLQWWDKERFWLVHSASGLRVPGSWTVDEAELILDLSRKWDWSIDKERRVACGLQLMALAEAVCKRSSQKGGER